MIPLATPFFYDPDQGDLLMDIFMRNSPATARFSSSGRAQPQVTRRLYSTDVNSASGWTGASFLGLLTTRFEMAPDEDWYAFDVTRTGVPLRLETSSPLVKSKRYSSVLNPRIELFSPANSLLAAGTPLDDGGNEFIQFTPTVSGAYRIRVTGENGTAGQYSLTCDAGGSASSD